MESIDLEFRLDQPRANDIVGNPLLMAGMGGGFEGTIGIRVLDGDGALLLETSTMASNLRSAWQATVDLPDPPPTTWGVVLVHPGYGADEHPGSISVPVCFGAAVVADYRSHLRYVVQSGDTLSSIAAAQAGLYSGVGWEPIFEANRHVIADPDLIHPGMVLRLPSNF
jgi:nucleoid-associated protein YgaU